MQEKIKKALVQLRTDHTHPSLRTSKVQGMPGVFEARIDGGNRLTFHREGERIVCRNHCNHDMLKRAP